MTAADYSGINDFPCSIDFSFTATGVQTIIVLLLISWPGRSPNGDARTGWAGMMKRAGRRLILMTSLTMQLAV
jgi:hypothetical protein